MNLSVEILKRVEVEFYRLRESLKKEDEQNGYCICAHCFQDRHGRFKIMKIQQYCLKRKRRLTQLYPHQYSVGYRV